MPKLITEINQEIHQKEIRAGARLFNLDHCRQRIIYEINPNCYIIYASVYFPFLKYSLERMLYLQNQASFLNKKQKSCYTVEGTLYICHTAKFIIFIYKCT